MPEKQLNVNRTMRHLVQPAPSVFLVFITQNEMRQEKMARKAAGTIARMAMNGTACLRGFKTFEGTALAASLALSPASVVVDMAWRSEMRSTMQLTSSRRA